MTNPGCGATPRGFLVCAGHARLCRERVCTIRFPQQANQAGHTMGYVAGYSILVDGSLRDFQKHSVTAGKNFDSSS